MKLTSDNETIARDKVLILYILDTVEKPVTNDALLELVLSIQDINYFYFQQFLLDLLNTKYIISYKKEDTEFYEITKQGVDALELTKDMIPGIIKLN